MRIYRFDLFGSGGGEVGGRKGEMSEKKFTPGPWSFDRDGVGGYRESDGELIRIASVERSPLCRERRVANARLMASAPDLLSALQAMLAEFEPGQLPDSEEAYTPEGLKAIEMARAAIEKAEGER